MRAGWIWILALAACRPPLPAYYRVTFVGATIAPRRTDGAPWHQKLPSRTWLALGAIGGAVVGHPGLGVELGKLAAGDPRALPPAPAVQIDAGGAQYLSMAVRPTLVPRWDDAVLVDARRLRPDDTVVITVLDGIDHDVIGDIRMPFRDLVARDARTISTIPNVTALDLRVEPATPTHATQTVWVPAESTASIAVQGGDLLQIRASGEACVAPRKCLPPDGDPTRVSEFLGPEHYRSADDNYSAFEDRPHASLVGMFGETPVWIGSGGRFRAPRTGVLTLAVNDTDKGNNSGGFTVEIATNPDP